MEDNKYQEVYIRSYESILGPGVKTKQNFNIPIEREFEINFIIFYCENSGTFEIRFDGLKNAFENPIVIYDSVMNQLIPFDPHPIAISGTSGLNITNLTNAEATLNYMLVGKIQQRKR